MEKHKIVIHDAFTDEIIDTFNVIQADLGDTVIKYAEKYENVYLEVFSNRIKTNLRYLK